MLFFKRVKLITGTNLKRQHEGKMKTGWWNKKTAPGQGPGAVKKLLLKASAIFLQSALFQAGRLSPVQRLASAAVQPRPGPAWVIRCLLTWNALLAPVL